MLSANGRCTLALLPNASPSTTIVKSSTGTRGLVTGTQTQTPKITLADLPAELLLRILAAVVGGGGNNGLDSTSRNPRNSGVPSTTTAHLLTVRLRPVAASSRVFLGLAKAVIARHRQRFALLAVGLSPSPQPTPETPYEFQWAPRSLADHFARWQRAEESDRRTGALAVSLDLYIHFTAPYSSPPLPGTKAKTPPAPPRRDATAHAVLSPSCSLSQLRHLTLYLPAHVPAQLESLTHLVRPLIALLDFPTPLLRSLAIRFAPDAQQGIQLWALQFARTLMSRPSTIAHLSLSLPVTWASTTPDPLVHSALVDLLTRSPAVVDGLTCAELEWPDLRVDIVARLALAATRLRKLVVRPMYWLPGPDDVTTGASTTGMLDQPTQTMPTTLVLGDAKSGIPPIPHPSSRFLLSCAHLVLEISHIRPAAAAQIAAVLVPGTGLLLLFPNLAEHLPPNVAVTLSWQGIPTCKSPTSLLYALNGIAHHRPHPIRDLGLVCMRKDLLAYIRLASVHRLLVHTRVTESAAPLTGAGGSVLDTDPLDVLVPHIMTMVPNAHHVWVVVEYPPTLMLDTTRAAAARGAASGSGWASLDAFGRTQPWFHELMHDRPTLARLVLVVCGRHGLGPPADMLEYAGYKRAWVASAPWIVGERDLGRRETVQVRMGPGLPSWRDAGTADAYPPALEYLGFGKHDGTGHGGGEEIWSLVLDRNTCR